MDTLAQKADIAQAEGDLPRASALLAPLHPNADDTNALETQVYQAILERRPAPIIPRLKEMLAKPDPALGYTNGELRFYLGWAQEVAGDHAAAQENWRQARSELESFLKEQPENFVLIGDLALTNMGLGDKAAALALAERAMAANPDRERCRDWSRSDRDPRPGNGAERESPTAPSPLYRNYSRHRTGALAAHVPLTPALLRLDPISIRFATIRASKNWLGRKRAAAREKRLPCCRLKI